jgi:hypothetical protein
MRKKSTCEQVDLFFQLLFVKALGLLHLIIAAFMHQQIDYL